MVSALVALALLQGPSGKVFIPTWPGLQQYYSYQHIDLADVKSTVTASGNTVLTDFTFPGTHGDTVHAILAEPKSAKPVPVVILMHGLGGNKEEMAQRFGKALLDDGIAYAAIDVPGHGSRATEADQSVLASIGMAAMTNKGDLLKAMLAADTDGKITKFIDVAITDGVIDERHLLDYVTSRPDIDYHHVGIIGESLGSIMATILGAVDPRVKDMLLMVGGDPGYAILGSLPPNLEEKAIETSCSLYAPHFMGPVRMLNGSHDTIIPRDATDRLYNAFPEATRSISWYNSDHFLPPLASEEAVQWTEDQAKSP